MYEKTARMQSQEFRKGDKKNNRKKASKRKKEKTSTSSASREKEKERTSEQANGQARERYG